MKDILVRAKLAPFEKKKDCCRSRGGTRCKICKHVVTTETFRSFSIQRDYCIKPDNLNCRSSNVVYHFSCKPCSKQYTSIAECFRFRFNNYKSAHRSFIKRNTVKQVSFHAYFEDDKHHGMGDWEITLTDQIDKVGDLRRRSIPSHQMDLMRVMWHTLTFLLTQRLDCPHFQRFDPLHLLQYINLYHYSTLPNYFTIYLYCY